MKKQRVVVAMSGGVDSATVAGLLLRQGYDVIGVTMRLWTLEDSYAPRHHRHCCSIEDIEDAFAVCQTLGIPHYVVNFEEEFRSQVVDYFWQEYSRGRTPNPCLNCNKYVKFGRMLDRAMALEADYLATGHYARIAHSATGYELWRAKDDFKDQSYVLYMLGQNELSRLLFPLGDYTKDEVRRLAAEMGLPVAQKLDSADICFVPDSDYRNFVSQYVTAEPGQIVDTSGRRLGDHDGISGYTIGQRRGLGVASKEPLYVIELRPEDNSVVVGSQDELLSDTLWAESLSFVSGRAPQGPTRIEAKGRYRSTDIPGTLTVEGARARVELDEPVRAVTPGQAVVFYHGDNVLGGGIISNAGRATTDSGYVTSSQSPTSP